MDAAPGAPALGSLVLVAAYPFARGPRGRLDALRSRGGEGDDAYLQTDGAPFPGFAGAAIVDPDGALAGFVLADRGGNRGWALPASRAAGAAVSILERMDRLELIMRDGDADKRIDRPFSAQKVEPVAEEATDEGLSNRRRVDDPSAVPDDRPAASSDLDRAFEDPACDLQDQADIDVSRMLHRLVAGPKRMPIAANFLNGRALKGLLDLDLPVELVVGREDILDLARQLGLLEGTDWRITD